MTILVDIDNTIEDLLGAWTKRLDEKYSAGVTKNDILEWDMDGFFPGLTHEQIFGVLKEEGFWKTVSPIPGAPEYLKRLIDDGHNVYLCTATDHLDIRPKYEDVLKPYFPFIPWNKVIVCSEKSMIKADLLIDDAPHNFENASYKGILFTQAHNLSFDAEKHGLARFGDWADIYEYISSGMKKSEAAERK